MQKSFYDVDLEEKTVDDLEELSIGKRTLQFVHAQFLHWPETMMTYLVEDEIVFSCDAFGSFGALNGKHFDDEINMEMIEKESRRYLSAIITSYLRFVQRAIAKVKDLGIGIKMIAPSHGPIYRKDPMWVVNHYDQWSRDELDKHVAIVYGSMYGFNQRTALLLKKELLELDVEVRIHNVSYTEMSKVLVDSVRAGVLVIGTPTYDAHPFPKIWGYVNEVCGKRFPKRPIFLFGNMGWGGGGVRKLKAQLEDSRYQVMEPIVKVKARPTEENKAEIKKLAKTIAEQLPK
ncbi:MAG: hypothetical protein GF411_01175 [Candidatus Lokiarchaeota archaeon]|nr:hypothetical protein [Candidatus Lokiarchaeota archaeon]